MTAGDIGNIVFGGGNLTLSNANTTVQPIIVNACGTVNTSALTAGGNITINMNSGASTAGRSPRPTD